MGYQIGDSRKCKNNGKLKPRLLPPQKKMFWRPQHVYFVTCG